MKTHLKFLAVGLFFAMASIVLPASAGLTNPVQISIPVYSLDVSDLDARDANNRPIKSVGAKRILKNIFVNNLRDLLLENLTPARRITLAFMSHTWDVVSGRFKPWVEFSMRSIVGWWQERKIKNLLINNETLFMAQGVQRTTIPPPHFFSQHLLTCIMSSTQILC